MYADTLPSELSQKSSVLPRMAGHAHVSFARKDNVTRLAGLDQGSPLRVLFPRPETGEPPLAAVTTVSGGLVGGDRLDMSVTLTERAKAVAIGQAAEKVYRSAGPDSLVDIALDVGAGGWLEWLPQETILFGGARLSRRTRIDVDPLAKVMAGECLVFGRLARGEVMRHGYVRDGWEIRQRGRLVWVDALKVEGNIADTLDAVVGFGGARAYATALYVGADAPTFLEAARELVSGGPLVRSGVTCVHGILVARWLSADPLALRSAFATYWSEMRRMTGGLPARMPRLWHV